MIPVLSLQGGFDDVSVDPSLPEFNMESEMAQLNLDQTSTEGPKSNTSVGTRTLKSMYANVRKTRSEEFRRHNSSPKLRSKTAMDKMRWDGHRSSYPAFASEVEGTLLMIGMSYMLTNKVQEGYKHLGMEYLKSDTFWQAHRIGYLQVQ
jgi:hypothetical protein